MIDRVQRLKTALSVIDMDEPIRDIPSGLITEDDEPSGVWMSIDRIYPTDGDRVLLWNCGRWVGATWSTPCPDDDRAVYRIGGWVSDAGALVSDATHFMRVSAP